MVIAHQTVLQERDGRFGGESVRHSLNVSSSDFHVFLLIALRLCALFFLSEFLDCPAALLAELSHGLEYHHRVYRAVKLAIFASLEALEKQHELRELEMAVAVNNHSCRVGQLMGSQFAFASGKLAQLRQLYFEPRLGYASAVGVAHQGDARCLPHVDFADVAAVLDLEAWVKLAQQYFAILAVTVVEPNNSRRCRVRQVQGC